MSQGRDLRLPGLAGSVGIVTGGTRGIGIATARLLAHSGVRLALSARSQGSCDRACDELRSAGCDVIGIVAHAGKSDDCAMLVRSTVEHFGRLDLVVANAGVNPVFDPLETLSQMAWDKVIDTNLAGPWHLARHALPAIADSGSGAMVMVSSIHAAFASAGSAAYGMSKAALNQMIRQLALEWGSRDIRINGVAPGTIRTEMIRSLLDRPGWKDDVIARTPLSRIGEAADVAGTIAFLLSPLARHVTGQILTVDGGETIRR